MISFYFDFNLLTFIKILKLIFNHRNQALSIMHCYTQAWFIESKYFHSWISFLKSLRIDFFVVVSFLLMIFVRLIFIKDFPIFRVISPQRNSNSDILASSSLVLEYNSVWLIRIHFSVAIFNSDDFFWTDLILNVYSSS